MKRNRFNNTIILAKKCLLLFIQFPSLFFFPIFGIAVLIGLVIFYGMFLYHKFGIHLFDATTFQNWQNISKIHFGTINILVFIALFFMGMIAILFIEFAMSYQLLKKLRKQATSIPTALMQSIRHSAKILHLALLLSIVNLKMIFAFEYVQLFIATIIRKLSLKKLVPEEPFLAFQNNIYLTMPILVDDNLSVKKALQESITLMQQHFGKTFSINVSFGTVFFLFFGITALATERIFSLNYNRLAGASAFIISLGILILITDMFQLLLQITTYSYCIGKPTGPFTASDFNASFILEKEHHE